MNEPQQNRGTGALRVLIVEDDPALARWLQRAYERDGYAAEVAPSGEAALARVAAGPFDLLLVDRGLPGVDGLGVVRALRAAGSLVPVLLMTGDVSGDEDVARGLDAGADDFLAKPFSPTLLRARTRAVLRRARPGVPAPALDTFAPAPKPAPAFQLNPAARCVRGPGGEAELTAKEYALLALLAARPGEAVPRARLLADVWGYAFDPGTNVVEVTLSRLRRKLAAAAPGVALRTVRGLGVVLDAGPDGPAEAEP